MLCRLADDDEVTGAGAKVFENPAKPAIFSSDSLQVGRLDEPPRLHRKKSHSVRPGTAL
jgi:hypothetical protein